jgi:hypothetical protein
MSVESLFCLLESMIMLFGYRVASDASSRDYEAHVEEAMERKAQERDAILYHER